MKHRFKRRGLIKQHDIDANQEEVLRYLEAEHPEIKNMDEQKVHQFLRDFFNQRELKKRMKLQEHLEVFNDAVLAIIITIIVLNLPMPSSHSAGDMKHLITTIGIYFISFVVIANFWLTHHFIFSKIRNGINEKVVVLDFAFMIELSLLPFLTKWMETDHTSLPIMIYGCVYLLATVTLMLISMTSNQILKHNYPKIYHSLQRIEWLRLGVFIPLNIILIIVAYWYPQVIFILYIVMPILSFLSYIFADEDERRFERRFEVKHLNTGTEKAGHIANVVADRLTDQLGDHITDQVADQVADQVTDQVADQVAEQLEDIIENKVREMKK